MSMDFYSFLCLILWFLCPYITSSAIQLCSGVDGKVCCGGYVWNEEKNKCTRCMGGFYGRNCDIPCKYPSFGWDCQSKCSCSKEDCHHMYGCRRHPSDCATGKHGDYCERSCRYPNYGKECQLFCSCDPVSCDPSSGCAGDSLSLRNIELSTVHIPASSTDFDGGSSTFYNIEPSTIPAPTPSTYFESSTNNDEVVSKSTNILHMARRCTRETGNVYKINPASYIAGIISLLVVAGLLIILYALTFLHTSVCIAQGEKAINNTL